MRGGDPNNRDAPNPVFLKVRLNASAHASNQIDLSGITRISSCCISVVSMPRRMQTLFDNLRALLGLCFRLEDEVCDLGALR